MTEDRISPVPIATATELWSRLVEVGVLRPQSYDADIVTLLKSQLPGSGSLAPRMAVVGWTARDLLRAMSPVVDSFAGLMRDLLSLYSDIAATKATNDNLTVAFEFDEGDVFDQSLAQFRGAVAALDQARAARGEFVLSPQRWNYPAANMNSPDYVEAGALRDDREGEWGFTLSAPPEAVDPALTRGVSLVYAVLTAACNTMLDYGGTMHAVHNNALLWGPRTDEFAAHRALFIDFTDYHPEVTILQLRADVEYLESRSTGEVQRWLRGIEEWCASFWDSDARDDAEAALESVLSLPMWGKRHELYSAWVVCVIAKAFKDRRLQFEVVDGTLKFPFKATKIASFEDELGPVELWAEVRSDASGDLTHGRKRGVQPDYRFLRPGQEPADTEMAVEVKQYRRAAAARHGDTARDYAQALPHARVTIVAHGPIGSTAIGRVGESDRSRVEFRENMRSLESVEAEGLVSELQQVFPPVPACIVAIEVARCSVEQVEILLGVQRRELVGLTNPRGSAPLPAIGSSTEEELVLEIVCHPERGHTIDQAGLRVALTFSDGEVRSFEALPPNFTKVWHIGTVRGASFLMSAETIESD